MLSSQYDALMRDIEGSLRTLVPRGWAVFNMNTDQVRRAVALVDAGQGTAADDLLAGQWGERAPGAPSGYAIESTTWARPLPQARSEADRLGAERQAQNAGSPDADAEGRRVDDRQFAETVSVLRLLQTSAMGWWTQRGHFRDDLIGNVYGSTDFVKRGLPADHGTKLRVSPDGQQTWFWRGTPSGWVLGIGLAANERGFLEWLYSASESPAGGPLDSPDEWGVAFETPPEWRS